MQVENERQNNKKSRKRSLNIACGFVMKTKKKNLNFWQLINLNRIIRMIYHYQGRREFRIVLRFGGDTTCPKFLNLRVFNCENIYLRQNQDIHVYDPTTKNCCRTEIEFAGLVRHFFFKKNKGYTSIHCLLSFLARCFLFSSVKWHLPIWRKFTDTVKK